MFIPALTLYKEDMPAAGKDRLKKGRRHLFFGILSFLAAFFCFAEKIAVRSWALNILSNANIGCEYFAF